MNAPSPTTTAHFKNKALAALLASIFGALGVHRLYLGLKGWWLPLGVSMLCLPALIGVINWYQSPAFFVLMIPMTVGFINGLTLALMPDETFDARYNPMVNRKNQSGWNAVLIAIFTLGFGAIVVMTTLALLFQTIFEF